MTIEQLIDEAVASGAWHSIRIFACKDGTSFVSMGRDHTTFVTDQCTDPSAKPSERLRMILEANLKPSVIEPVDEFEDLLG